MKVEDGGKTMTEVPLAGLKVVDLSFRPAPGLAVNPAVVYAEVTSAGEDSSLPPYEPVIAAKTGRMQNLVGIIANAGPHFAAVPVASHATAQNVVSGVLAALYQRGRGGGGKKISTSLVQGLMPYDMGQSLLEQVRPDREQADVSRLMPTLNYHPVQCGDHGSGARPDPRDNADQVEG